MENTVNRKTAEEIERDKIYQKQRSRTEDKQPEANTTGG